jgi:uncharacterized protein (TIGR00369 family)
MTFIGKEQLTELIWKSSFHRFLEVAVESVSENAITLRLPFKEEFLAGASGTHIHGGVIASLIDIAGDFVFAPVLGTALPTISIHVNYLSPGGREDLIADARIVKLGRSVGVSDIAVTNPEGKLIAVGRGLYNTAAAAKPAAPGGGKMG